MIRIVSAVLQFIPMPVLYGVFLYMGVSSLKGIQVSHLLVFEDNVAPKFEQNSSHKLPVKISLPLSSRAFDHF